MIAKPHDTRNALLDHGTRLFLDAGYASTGIQAVLAAAGVPKGSFYHYFSGKEEFGLEVLGRYFDAHMVTVERFLGDKSQAPLARLRKCFGFYIDYFKGRDCREGCMLGGLSQELASQNETFRGRLKSLFATWTGRVADCFREAREAGDLDERFDPAQLAEFCVTSWEGALLAMKANREPGPLHTWDAFFFDVVLAPPRKKPCSR